MLLRFDEFLRFDDFFLFYLVEVEFSYVLYCFDCSCEYCYEVSDFFYVDKIVFF